MRITDDVKRFSEMCYSVGVMSGNLDEGWADDMADDVVTYITQLFTHAQDIDAIPTDEYEKEVNALKDEINRWKEEYQEEHLLRLKVQEDYETLRKCTWEKAVAQRNGDFSHHPSPNIYKSERYDAFEGRWKPVGGEDDAT